MYGFSCLPCSRLLSSYTTALMSEVFLFATFLSPPLPSPPPPGLLFRTPPCTVHQPTQGTASSPPFLPLPTYGQSTSFLPCQHPITADLPGLTARASYSLSHSHNQLRTLTALNVLVGTVVTLRLRVSSYPATLMRGAALPHPVRVPWPFTS